jgi:hypothetical protein
MSGNQPFAQHAFIITTPDTALVIPGLQIRAVAIMMADMAKQGIVSLHAKMPATDSIIKCYFVHRATVNGERLVHEATITEKRGLGATETVQWTTPLPHIITVTEAWKMDTPRGLFRAKCSCGTYESCPTSQAHARAAGAAHSAAKNSQEITGP